MIILGILLGILLGLANFYLTSRLVRNIEIWKSNFFFMLAAKFFLGLILIGGGIVFSYIYFGINPVFLLLGLIIGRTVIFFEFAKVKC